MKGLSKKERTHGHGQQCGDCSRKGLGGGRDIEGENSDGKIKIH